jgi:hypothetical protein
MPAILSICSCFDHPNNKYKNNFQLLLFVKATAFSLGLEDTLSQIYFSKKEKQREELIKLIGNTFHISILFKFIIDAASKSHKSVFTIKS